MCRDTNENARAVLHMQQHIERGSTFDNAVKAAATAELSSPSTILHAMTDHGLLAVPDTIASNWLSEPALTAELVFEEVLEDGHGQDDADYHNTMTGTKFVAWLRNRLLPTFAALYPGKKMYLALSLLRTDEKV